MSSDLKPYNHPPWVSASCLLTLKQIFGLVLNLDNYVVLSGRHHDTS